ncbi:MAG TPA: hypothetical protein ENJ51_03660 [Leucothrix mucor]|uniref:Uncharacterized protein n=1 Tax=Leucothrix mucor TaxID=45248 RepID=A0A7V2SYL0_LEUMU|nr:hypothetical protein [Leucothrix mucor]HFC91887.1 hypothetical protein [Leucothrix mucor]
MKNKITKLLAVVTFGLILSSSAMANEEVDTFTLGFQNNSQDIMERDAVFSKISFSNPSMNDHATDSNVLDLNYDSVK